MIPGETSDNPRGSASPAGNSHPAADLPWHVVYTPPRREPEALASLLDAGAAEAFLPLHRQTYLDAQRRGDEPSALRRSLLFDSYVFFRGPRLVDVVRRIRGCRAISYVVGTNPGRPSSVDDTELALLRHLMATERLPILDEQIRLGRRARVIAGPLEGVEGLILSRNKREARLATTIRLVGELYELTVPLEMLSVTGFEAVGLPAGKPHRGGRRARRALMRRSGEREAGSA